MITIDAALKDPNLLGAALGDSSTWITWMSILCAAFSLPLDVEQQQIFTKVAGGRAPPTKRVRELWVTAGRRSGKSRVAAAIAVYMALFQKYKLSKGERGLVLILSMTQDQAKTVFNYIMGFLTASDVLAKEVASFTSSEIRLKNGITIAIHTSSFRSVRGPTLCCCVLDEVAFYHSDTSANPDVEIYTAILPSLLTTKGLLVAISSAYKRHGLLYSKHKDFAFAAWLCKRAVFVAAHC
jgi:phage terminase large subunit-like protein